MKHDEIHERFLTKINVAENGCWEWTADVTLRGYGQFSVLGRNTAAYKYSYMHYNGEVTPGKVVDHICNNTKCVNPEHLRLLTSKENILRGVGITAVNARKTHCLNGHELSGDNLYIIPCKYGRLHRKCKICSNATSSKWKRLQTVKRKACRKKALSELTPSTN